MVSIRLKSVRKFRLHRKLQYFLTLLYHIHPLFNIFRVQYKDLKAREMTSKFVAPTSSISRPNYEDILRRVSVVIHQHIIASEDRLRREQRAKDRNVFSNVSLYGPSLQPQNYQSSHNGPTSHDSGALSSASNSAQHEEVSSSLRKAQMEKFSEHNFVNSEYMYHFIRYPILKQGFVYVLKELKQETLIPPLATVHEFLVKIFFDAKLSAECSIGKLLVNITALFVLIVVKFKSILLFDLS